MRARRAKALIDKQRDAISGLRVKSYDWAPFNSWHRETEIIIKRLFGEATPHARTFSDISYSSGVFVAGGGRDYEEERRRWSEGFDEAEAFLRVLIDEIDRDTHFGCFHPQKATAIVDEKGKITLYWLTRHLPARFVWIGLGALVSALLLGVKLGQVSWIKELFTQ